MSAARLALFTGIALFAALHWAALLAAPPVAHAAAAAIAATAGGLVLARTASLRVGAVRASVVRAIVVLATALACVLAAGLPLALLDRGGLVELADGIGRGLAGVRTLRWPYAGGDEWVRLAVMLVLGPVLAAASALAFWPVRRGREVLSGIGLALLVALFAVAVVEHDFGADLRRGGALFLLLAVWLGLPRLGRWDRGRPAMALVGAGLVALALAATLDADRPWVEYRTWADDGSAASFDWNHTYGPIEWPRSGTTLLQVRSERPHYWKAQSLDHFDGLRWSRSPQALASVGGDIPPRRDPAWIERLNVTVRELSSDLVVGAGSTFSVAGAGATASSPDGTTVALEGPLEEGDAYKAVAYVPDPSAEQMRAAAGPYGSELAPYVSLALPPEPGRRADRAPAAPTAPTAFMGFRGEAARPSEVARGVRRSPYRDVDRLARRLAPDSLSTYDAVKAVERHLQTSYAYSERPPVRPVPLASFLLRDRTGYCQQFSGAMALMLRLRGIPARVSAGFTPGVLERSSREYRVRDLDAHSWVEVFFPGIGWVPFDPTPSAAPAESQSTGGPTASAARGGPSDGGSSSPGELGDRVSDASTGRAPETSPTTPSGVPRTIVAGALTLLLTLAVSLLALRVGSRRRARATEPDPELGELHFALARLGRAPGPGTTLAGLERCFEGEGRSGAAAYARALRERRFGAPGGSAPDRVQRAALRRDLGPRAGPLGRLRAWLALPPRLGPGRP